MRAGMGAVYYAKGRPSLDVYLHGLRLLLIVVAIFATARGGLLAVSIAMSVVELGISAIGQVFASRLVKANFSSVFTSVAPSLRTATVCAAAALAGKALAGSLQIHGALALAVIALPPAVAFLWLEAATARELAGSAFSSARGVRVAARARRNGVSTLALRVSPLASGELVLERWASRRESWNAPGNTGQRCDALSR